MLRDMGWSWPQYIRERQARKRFGRRRVGNPLITTSKCIANVLQSFIDKSWRCTRDSPALMTPPLRMKMKSMWTFLMHYQHIANRYSEPPSAPKTPVKAPPPMPIRIRRPARPVKKDRTVMYSHCIVNALLMYYRRTKQNPKRSPASRGSAKDARKRRGRVSS